jgi:hypothetical protein
MAFAHSRGAYPPSWLYRTTFRLRSTAPMALIYAQ